MLVLQTYAGWFFPPARSKDIINKGSLRKTISRHWRGKETSCSKSFLFKESIGQDLACHQERVSFSLSAPEQNYRHWLQHVTRKNVNDFRAKFLIIIWSDTNEWPKNHNLRSTWMCINLEVTDEIFLHYSYFFMSVKNEQYLQELHFRESSKMIIKSAKIHWL